MREFSFPQRVIILISLSSVGTAFWQQPDATLWFLMVATQLGFLVLAGFRIILVLCSRESLPAVVRSDAWPTYTILAALHDEAEVVPQLVARLSALDYPSEKLQGMLLIEAHDAATLAAARRANRPLWLDVVVVPPGRPLTKPRALNHGLERATGTLLTVFDAEDHPHPQQLKEAASRFAIITSARLACIQAPLRIRRPDYALPGYAFLQQQFAIEYAALFEVTLPGLARLGLPFPLGGTSNHFRTDILKSVGGWDSFNVTEDADLGFRLWRRGWKLGVMNSPTHEVAPNALQDWLPQRTRWLKGFMQTWGVHTRTLRGLGLAGLASLTLTLGGTLASAGIHALAVSWLIATVLIALLSGQAPAPPAFAVAVMALGTAAALLGGQIGARRAGLTYSVRDMVMSPLYWSLMSLAFAHAVWRLILEPYTWDKTRHRPDLAPIDDQRVHAGRQVI